jgi:isoleucyl-tRNA synthetase
MAIDFKLAEEKAREVWAKHSEEIKLAVQNDPKKELFSFLEGPPTANAPPGLHHLEVRTFKDIICKFKFMQGFSVPRKGGWDCHGLPVEVQVEKKLGLNSKKDIVTYGQNKFIEQCKTDVFSNIEEWENSTKELDYWVDLENPYRTLDNNYVESVWWSLKELHKKNLLYEGNKVVPFCPRCSTPLSSHEVSQGYKEIKEKSVIVKFKLKDDDKKLLVWTTTPWTLPSNLAIAINPDLTYVVVNHEGEKLVLVEDLISIYFDEPEIIEKMKGSDLVGKEYEPLMPYFENLEGAFKIIGGDFVTTEDGTGIVHMAPAFGEIDYDACKENGIPFVKPIDQAGKFTSEIKDFEGVFIKDADKDIALKLNEEGKMFKILNHKHDYPFCWRCDSPLMYYAIDSWFVRATAAKERMVELNKKINWHPEHIQEGRFGMWLENLKDWNLSRFKFWGTPLPVWRCECGKEKVIGSVEELKKESLKEFSEYDLHRPWIDDVKLKCECGKEMKRIPDVIDCWYDSGSASFAQFHYPFENKEEFEKRFPYDFISEAIDQTRGWFYTLHALGTMLFDDVAYKNVICAGHILDGKGEKMSKTKGNMIKPREIIDAVGVDAVRLQMCVSDTGNSKRFSQDMIKESVLPFLNVLYNCKTYYGQLKDSELSEVKVEDKWILSKLNGMIMMMTSELEEFNLYKAIQKLMDFVVNDFSRTYIRFTRDRTDNKKIVEEVLKKVCLILSPYAPYVAEWIFQDFNEGESVHFDSWPESEEYKMDGELEKEFSTALEIIEAGLRSRDRNKVGLKWPLSKAVVSGVSKLEEEVKEIVKVQLNVKELILNKGKEIEIELDFNLTPELEAEGYARELSRKVQAYRKKLGLNKEDFINLTIVIEEDFEKVLETQKQFLIERTNSKVLNFSNDFEISVENSEEFKIKTKKGLILIELN